jgi:hypothetical protein
VLAVLKTLKRGERTPPEVDEEALLKAAEASTAVMEALMASSRRSQDGGGESLQQLSDAIHWSEKYSVFHKDAP